MAASERTLSYAAEDDGEDVRFMLKSSSIAGMFSAFTLPWRSLSNSLKTTLASFGSSASMNSSMDNTPFPSLSTSSNLRKRKNSFSIFVLKVRAPLAVGRVKMCMISSLVSTPSLLMSNKANFSLITDVLVLWTSTSSSTFAWLPIDGSVCFSRMKRPLQARSKQSRLQGQHGPKTSASRDFASSMHYN